MFLSASLRADLKAAVYEPQTSFHPPCMSFCKLSPSTTRALCNCAMSEYLLIRHEQLFCFGESCAYAYFIAGGGSTYLRRSEEGEDIVECGDWACKAALWTRGLTRGCSRSSWPEPRAGPRLRVARRHD